MVLAAAFHAAVLIAAVSIASTVVAAVSHGVVSIVASATMAVASTALTALAGAHHSAALADMEVEDLAASASNFRESLLSLIHI